MPESMFATLENTCDNSARRRWTTFASFTLQSVGLSSLIVISLIWVRPPQVHWLQISAPPSFKPEVQAQVPRGHRAVATTNNPRQTQIFEPRSIPRQIATFDDTNTVPTAPDFPTIETGYGHRSGADVPNSIGEGIAVVMPPRPVPSKPLLVSHLAEANLLHRVQPIYPPLARQARVQGMVELRAIISKTGTIENLVVVHGHPMLAGAAVEAVRQWRYRPYLLNNEPVEVETEITVNFLLSGG